MERRQRALRFSGGEQLHLVSNPGTSRYFGADASNSFATSAKVVPGCRLKRTDATIITILRSWWFGRLEAGYS